MVGDGTQLRTAEAARLMNLSDRTVVNYADDGLLRVVWTAGGHRRIVADSVSALLRVLAMPKGPEQEAAKDQLRRRNRGEL
jgi:excisionase family DNA binding protein